MSTKLRAIMVSVNYTDLLSVTLPYNRHHFDEVMVVTDMAGEAELAHIPDSLGVRLWPTDAFTRGGAVFNKWMALEEGLDAFGRHGVICLMDADILWPKSLPNYDFEFGKLYSPLRRMAPWPCEDKYNAPIPPEDQWWQYPIHRNINEWAGYTQIFHAHDPVLGPTPWHEINWKHAGGADSFFQQKWALLNKVRPTWECLHLGEAGVNWYGRATAFADGSIPNGAEIKRTQLREMWANRNKVRRGDRDRFSGEKLG